ncbi:MULTISPECIES: hypothetical protein [unclassified Pseudonocardia]|uniref:hypothetical protein n=1 Tax=unclassified Pseudonocardia TaxID=2619320 RepID=UPI001CF65EDD|nr:hypothetical protein [Pseudonocardia sp. ICBG601]
METEDAGPADDEPLLGHRAARKWRQSETALRQCLEPGEQVRGFFQANTLRPLTDYIAVTTTRILGGLVSDLSRTPPQLRDARLADIVALESESAALTRLPRLSARMRNGEQVFLGQLLVGDDEQLLRAAATLPERPHPTPPPPQATAQPDPQKADSAADVRVDTPAPTNVTPTVTELENDDSTTLEQRLGRLLDEAVIDDQQARYIRSVLRP